MLLAVHRALRSTVTVGADGVVVRSLGVSRSYGLDLLREARAEYGALVLELEDGRVRRVPLGGYDGISHVEALVERINAAHEARRRGAKGALALPGRSGRSIDAWRGALGAVVGRAEGYREAPVDAGALRALVGNAAAGVEQRVAAALALGQLGDREVRERVRVAVYAGVLGRVDGDALEHAAAGSLDEKSLAAAEQEESDAKRGGGEP